MSFTLLDVHQESKSPDSRPVRQLTKDDFAVGKTYLLSALETMKNEYAAQHNFLCRAFTRRERNSGTYFSTCSRSGRPQSKKADADENVDPAESVSRINIGQPPRKKKRTRKSMKCGCKWRLTCRRVDSASMIDDPLVKIIFFYPEHTNGCDPTERQLRMAQRASCKRVLIPEGLVSPLIYFMRTNPDAKQIRSYLNDTGLKNLFPDHQDASSLRNLKLRIAAMTTRELTRVDNLADLLQDPLLSKRAQ